MKCYRCGEEMTTCCDPRSGMCRQCEVKLMNAGSFGGALARGRVVVLTAEKCVPDVICQIGSELEALEMLNEMGIIRLLRPKPA